MEEVMNTVEALSNIIIKYIKGWYNFENKTKKDI